MTNRSYSPAGALRRFECTGGQHLFFVFSVKDCPRGASLLVRTHVQPHCHAPRASGRRSRQW